MKKLILGLLLGLLSTNAHAIDLEVWIECQASSITCSNATSVLEACNLTRGRGDRVEFRERENSKREKFVIDVYENGVCLCCLKVETGERANELKNVAVRLDINMDLVKLDGSGNILNVVSRRTNKALATIHLEKLEHVDGGILYEVIRCEGSIIIWR